MANITETTLKRQIRDGIFEKVYCIYGEESYLVKYYTKELEKAILRESDASFNFHIFYGDSLEIEDVYQAADALPLFAHKKCIKLVNILPEKLDERNLKGLKKLIGDLPETVVLIISQIDETFPIKKSTKHANLLKFLVKNGAVLELKRLGPVAIRRQLISWAKRLDTQISENGAARLIERCGNSLSVLKQELAKVCAFAEYSEVTTEMIDRVTGVNLETTVFVLTKALMAKNYKEVYRQLDFLFSQKEEPVVILAVIASSYIDLLRVKIALQSGVDVAELGKIFDYKGKMFRLDIAKRECGKLSTKQIENCLEIIVETDYMMKHSKIDEKVLLEQAIAKISLS